MPVALSNALAGFSELHASPVDPPPWPITRMSKIVRITTSPISAMPRTFTDSSTSNQQNTLITMAAANAKIGQGMSQLNQVLKFWFAKYAKPPSSETSNRLYAIAPQMPVIRPRSRPSPCEMKL